MKRDSKTVTIPGLLCPRQRNAGGSLATTVMGRLTKDDERGDRPKLKTPASNNITIFSVVSTFRNSNDYYCNVPGVNSDKALPAIGRPVLDSGADSLPP